MNPLWCELQLVSFAFVEVHPYMNAFMQNLNMKAQKTPCKISIYGLYLPLIHHNGKMSIHTKKQIAKTTETHPFSPSIQNLAYSYIQHMTITKASVKKGPNQRNPPGSGTRCGSLTSLAGPRGGGGATLLPQVHRSGPGMAGVALVTLPRAERLRPPLEPRRTGVTPWAVYVLLRHGIGLCLVVAVRDGDARAGGTPPAAGVRRGPAARPGL